MLFSLFQTHRLHLKDVCRYMLIFNIFQTNKVNACSLAQVGMAQPQLSYERTPRHTAVQHVLDLQKIAGSIPMNSR